MRFLRILLIAFLPAAAMGEITLEDAKKNGMGVTLQNYIRDNAMIADICIYERTWIPPSEKFPKGQSVQRAVVTHVHCGPVKVGDRLQFVNFVEDDGSVKDPKFYHEFTSGVPGDLYTFFYDPGEGEKVVDGALKIDGDGHWKFRRVEDVFAELFALELRTNPKLKPKKGSSRAVNRTTSGA